MRISQFVRSCARRCGYDIVRYSGPARPIAVLDLAVKLAVCSPKAFFFIQIGAGDGVQYDPIRHLVKKYHLPGLLVEPLPDMYDLLIQNYGGETQLRFENVAVAHYDGVADLWRLKPGEQVALSHHALATLDERRIRRWARRLRLSDRVECIQVKCMTWERLVTKHEIDDVTLLQVDAEGFDLEVVRMCFGCGMRPYIVNFEHVNLPRSARRAALELLSAYGYRYLNCGSDTLAVRDLTGS